MQTGDLEKRNTAQVFIRKMRPEDTASAMALLAQWNMAPVQASASIPQPERDRLELDNTFVAILQDKLVGVASWLRIDATRAETASLAVDRKFIGTTVGQKLQEARLAEMRDKGIVVVRTEADRPEVIRWYMKKFGYRIVGTNRKRHAFGSPEHDSWTVLELLLE